MNKQPLSIFNWYIGLNNVKNPSIKAISLECIKLGYHKYTHKRNVNKLLKEAAYILKQPTIKGKPKIWTSNK
jgi:hypothetical protein